MSAADNRGLAMRNAGIGLAIVALAVVAGVIWWRGRAVGPADGGGTPAAIDAAGSSGFAVDRERGADAAAGTGATVPGEPPAALGDDRRAARERVPDVWNTRLGGAISFPEPLHGAAACERIDTELARVCAALDAGVGLDDGADSCEFLRELAGRLAARPPTLPESRDADAWFGNAFHLFRALGGARLAAARRLVEAEPDLIEPLALAAYRWAITRESCRDEGEPVAGLTPSRVYDYATYAFTSFGGQAYLRRRAPRLEALGCFYALSALELSIEAGHNPHGVDPRREIERCRALLDAQPFVWSEEYGRELDRMTASWRQRTGGS